MSAAQSVAVLGYGAIGRQVVAQLQARGTKVTLAQRSRPKDLPPDVSFKPTDLADPKAAADACAGVAAVICAVGLPYTAKAFTEDWPVVMTNGLNGCAASGARFVLADNLYMYGPQTTPLREDMALTAYGGKPKARAVLTRMWQEAHAAGKVQATAVRAADFYGADAPTSLISAFGVVRLLQGKAAMSPFPADQPHDFTYLPDFARALITLADAPDADYGQAWHVPNAPTRTLREVLALAAGLIGVKPRLSVMPEPVRRVLGLFNPILAELGEMRFQWQRPYHVDASKFIGRFGGQVTPLEQGLAETIAAYRATG